MTPCLLGIDLGTSGTKTILFDPEGRALASASAEYPLYQPQNGWAEQDPEDWWRAARDTIRAVVTRSGVDPSCIRGIGISGQMHGLVLTDADGVPLRRAILWCDGRTQQECDEITETIGRERLISLTANPALTGFTAGKLLWVRRHEPGLFAQAAHLLLPKDYLRLKLTGEYCCDMTDGSGTNLMDVKKRCWSREICDRLEIPSSLLPPLLESCEAAGTVTPRAAAETGLAAGTVVAAGAGDNMAAAIGTGVVAPGAAFITLGTSGVIFSHAAKPQIDPAGRVHTFCAAVPGACAVMSCTLAAGLSLRWFRDCFCQQECEEARLSGTDPYAVMDQEAADIPIGAERLIFLPYLMGERSPLMDSRARGAFIGLSAVHDRRHMLRAVMEGVLYSQRQNLDILRAMKTVPAVLTACGGGAKSPLWRQMTADVLGLPVQTLENTEGPALGAAILAGVAAGIYADVSDGCARMVRSAAVLHPDAARTAAYEKVYGVYRSLYPALRDSFHALSRL